MRFHKIANVNKALDYIASKGVKLVSIGAEGKWGVMGKCTNLPIGQWACSWLLLPSPFPPAFYCVSLFAKLWIPAQETRL